jgi:hypothetical protein
MEQTLKDRNRDRDRDYQNQGDGGYHDSKKKKEKKEGSQEPKKLLNNKPHPAWTSPKALMKGVETKPKPPKVRTVV